MKQIVVFLSILFCLSPLAAATEVAIVEINYLWAAELVPVIETLLSPQGKVSVSERTNALIVVDEPEAIQRVYAYLKKYDVPTKQVIIRVRLTATTVEKNDAISAGGSLSAPPPKGELHVSAKKEKQRSNVAAEFHITTAIGKPAYIRITQDIPYRTEPPVKTDGYPAESGFDITPALAGDNLLLRIVPRFTYGGGDNRIIRYYTAQTDASVPFGRWVEISGVNTQEHTVWQEILSRRKRSDTHSLSMSVLVEKKW
jgi:hypothetical protein